MAGRYGRLGILSPSEREAVSNAASTHPEDDHSPDLLSSSFQGDDLYKEGCDRQQQSVVSLDRSRPGKVTGPSSPLPLPPTSSRSEKSTTAEASSPEYISGGKVQGTVSCLKREDRAKGVRVDLREGRANDAREGNAKKDCDDVSMSPHSEGYIDQGTGCLNCGADDDHANLLLCEACNDEYHTYCLDPPLRSVPEGDFFCDKCKPFHLHAQADDGLNDLVGVLPPAFTSRFGEIVWAAGGVGFGWWPACIYDPRLTVGAARNLARSNLGKKHLVYFFECHDAPFTVLGNSKLVPWDTGILEEYDLGRTARASGKNKSFMFDKALAAASVEAEKPLDMRMEWNHPKDPLSTSRPDKPASEIRPVEVTAPPEDLGSARKKQRKPTTEEKEACKASVTRSGRSIKPVSADIVASEAEYRALTAALALSKAEAEQSIRRRQHERGEAYVQNSHAISNRSNLSESVLALSGFGSAIEIESAEDGQLFCKILRKITAEKKLCVDGSGINQNDWPSVADASVNVGFITLPSRRSATFADARRAMLEDLEDDCLPASSKWRFYVPKLGPMSLKQEEKLGPMLPFLKSTTSDYRLGEGTSRSPLKIVVTEI